MPARRRAEDPEPAEEAQPEELVFKGVSQSTHMKPTAATTGFAGVHVATGTGQRPTSSAVGAV